MRRRVRVATAASAALIPILVLSLTPALAETEAPEAAAAKPRVVAAKTVVPRRRLVFEHRFRPWSRPTPRQVREIIRIEAARWDIAPSRLARRVGCESGFAWAAGNGSFRGLLQFHPSTFQRGLRTIGSRRVRLVRERTRVVRRTRVLRWSDGRVERRRGRRVRQRIVHVYEGRIPARPGVTHGWAQLRIGAQSIAGRSAVSSGEWTCPA